MTPQALRLPRPSEAPALLAALAAALAADRAGVPLAFVIGPLIATAGFAVAGRPVFAPVAGRKAGQLVIGAGIGLKITLSIVMATALWVPLMVAAGLAAVVLAGLAAAPMAAAARIDRRTAFFCMLPGGLSEMANVGASVGAASEPVALTQAIRVALVVLLMPPVVMALGVDAGLAVGALAPPLSAPHTLVVLALAPLGVLGMRAAGVNNPWILGSILSAGVLSTAGVLQGAMPAPLFHAGQFVLGITIGARFSRDSLRRLPRVAVVAVAALTAFASALMLMAAGLSHLAPFDFATLALATSPGGMVEMAVTAQVLHLDVAMVTTFHLVRAVLMNGFALHYWRVYARLTGEDTGAR